MANVGSCAPPKPQRQYPSLTKIPADSAIYSPRSTGGGQDGRSAFPMPPSGYITPDLRRNMYSTGGGTYRYVFALVLLVQENNNKSRLT